jgi:hypothetical protein
MWCCWYLSTIDHDDEPSLSSTEARKVPKSLEEIVRITKFNKSEIRLLYKGFKQVWKFIFIFLKFLFFFKRNVQVEQLPNGNFKRFIRNFFLMEIAKIIHGFYFEFWIDENGCILHSRLFIYLKHEDILSVCFRIGLHSNLIGFSTWKYQGKNSLDLSILWYLRWWKINQTSKWDFDWIVWKWFCLFI